MRNPKVEFHSAVVMFRREFSSDVDIQNTINPKPFIG
jgi:hypothetical protein